MYKIFIFLAIFIACNKKKYIPINHSTPTKIIQFKGNIKVNDVAITNNLNLNQGDTIETGITSYAIIEYKNIGRVIIKENSLVSLISLNDFNIELNQTKGTMITKINNSGKYTVNSLDAISITRENKNTFEISCNPKTKTVNIYLLEGNMLIVNNKNIYLEALQKVNITNNKITNAMLLNKHEIDLLTMDSKNVEVKPEIISAISQEQPKTNLSLQQIKVKYGKLYKIILINNKMYTGAVIQKDNVIYLYTEKGDFSIRLSEVKTLIPL